RDVARGQGGMVGPRRNVPPEVLIALLDQLQAGGSLPVLDVADTGEVAILLCEAVNVRAALPVKLEIPGLPVGQDGAARRDQGASSADDLGAAAGDQQGPAEAQGSLLGVPADLRARDGNALAGRGQAATRPCGVQEAQLGDRPALAEALLDQQG